MIINSDAQNKWQCSYDAFLNAFSIYYTHKHAHPLSLIITLLNYKWETFLSRPVDHPFKTCKLNNGTSLLYSIKPLYKLVSHNGPVTCCSFNKNETMLVTGSRDMVSYLFNKSSAVAVQINEPMTEFQVWNAYL